MLFLMSPYIIVFGFTNHSHYEKKMDHLAPLVNEQVSSIFKTINSIAL